MFLLTAKERKVIILTVIFLLLGGVLRFCQGQSTSRQLIKSDIAFDQTVKDASRKEAPKKINVNNSTQSELESLPGIGPALASRIIDERAVSGYFLDSDDLKKVKGLGAKKLDKIKDLIEF